MTGSIYIHVVCDWCANNIMVPHDHTPSETALRAELEAAQAEVARLRAALDHIHSGASAVIAACEAYGETDDLHLWQEVEDEARAALDGTAEGGGE